LIERGALQVAYLIEQGAPQIRFAGSLKFSSLGSGEEEGAEDQVLFLRVKVQGSSCFGKRCKDFLASGKGARSFLLREKVRA
jgi:hypothetical protein